MQGLFEIEAGEAIEAKGFAEPVPVYRVLRAKPRAFGLTTRGVEGVETPMIGREAELGSLQEAMQAVGRERAGRFVTVVGEAGLGKSRLLEEFERWLKPEAMSIELFKGRATLETLDLPNGLLRDLIGNQVGILEDDPLAEVRTKLVEGFRAAIGEDANLERNAHFVGHLLGYDLHDSPHLQGVLDDPRQIYDRAQIYLTDYLAALAAERTLVLFLEDVHWADGSSLDILLRLFSELSGQQVLVVALTRPVVVRAVAVMGRCQPSPAARTGAAVAAARAGNWSARCCKRWPTCPTRCGDLITENAEGNPFYLEELIKMLIEDGVIVKSEPRWRIRVDQLGEVRIPPTLTGVIQARIEGLPQSERRVLQQASVVGRVFWDEAVCYLNRDEPPSRTGEKRGSDETRQGLDTLQAREMIFEHATSVFSDAAEYLFKHSVLREVTYESVLKSMRRVYHAMVADWLIAHGGDGAGKTAGLIAGHLEKAGRNEEALDYLSQAAEAAVANYALNEAVDFYTRALGLTPEQDLGRRYRLLLGRTRVFATQADRSAQREDLETLTSIADTLSDDRKRMEVFIEWAWLAFWISDFPEMMAAATRAIGLAETAQLRDLAGEAYNALAWANVQLGNHEDALIHEQVALDLARKAANLRSEGRSLGALGMIHNALGNYAPARDYSEGALALARELGDPKREAVALSNLGVTLTLLGDYSNAQEMYRQDLVISRDIGDPVSEATAHVNLGWVGEARGEWDLARDHALAGVEMKRKAAHKEAMAEGLVWLAHAWLGLEQPEKAIAAYQESLELRRTLDQAHLAMGALAGLARAALFQDDVPEARAYVDEIMKYLAEGGSLNGTWEPLRIYLTCFQVLERVGAARSEQILGEAIDILQQRAKQIPNEVDRHRYLEDIPWHRDLVAAWKRRQGPT